MLEAGDELGIAGDEAAAQARRRSSAWRANGTPARCRARRPSGAGLEHARRRRAVIDLAVAFIDDEHEIIGAGERDRLLEISEIGDGALRVGRAAEIEQRAALELLSGSASRSGRKPVAAVASSGTISAPAMTGAAEIDEVIGIGQQHDRRLAGLCLGHRQAGRHVEAFLGAGERQHMAIADDHAVGQMIAAAEPAGAGRAVFGRPGHRRIAVPQMRALGDDAREQRRRRVLRLTDRHEDRRLVRTRAYAGEQLAEPGEGIVGKASEPGIGRQ